MRHPDTHTAKQLRADLLKRIDAYQAETGIGDARIGTEAVRDHKIIGRIRSGENLTVRMYGRLVDWLDAQRTAA